MVISNILGGLGNQLFQYAAGRYISEKYNTPLKLDVTGFKDYKRSLDLDKFNTRFEIATAEDIRKVLPMGNVGKMLQLLKPSYHRTYHRETVLHYDHRFEKIGPNVYLKGYFQNESYFKPIADIIRKELVIADQYVSNVAGLAMKMEDENSVSIHIRRGDYTSASAAGVHPILTEEYYNAAIQIIQQRVRDPQFYFFSDDVKWVKENLQVDNAVYVSGEISKTHLEDFHLMCHCRHNIIANSSFSWWCAWLNNYQGKIVIATRDWFTKGWQEVDDRIPFGWIKI